MTIKADSLKSMLSLFDQQKRIMCLDVFDTGYSNLGKLCEDISKRENTVKNICTFDYDFNSLIRFEVQINSVKVKLDSDSTLEDKQVYELYGKSIDLTEVIETLRDKEISCPREYNYSFETSWKN